MNHDQLDIFDFMYEDFKYDTTKPIRVIELFAGIGTQRMAFDKLGVDYEVVAISEVDKFAILSYAIIHTEYLDIRDTYFDTHAHTPLEMSTVLQNKNVGINFKTMKHTINENTNIETLRDYFLADKLSGNLGDISKVKGKDMPKTIDLMTYSFPCTDLSKAGKQEGLSNTRSGLVYEVFRIVEELKEINNKPTTLLMENVIDLIQAKFVNEFNEMQLDLEKYGYQNYNFVMNSKDFGVAQNRQRVFMISLPKETNYKEPIPFRLDKKLKDYLEEGVDDKYYLSRNDLKWAFGNALNKKLKDVYDREKAIINKDIAYTLSTKQDRRVGDSNFIAEDFKEEITVKEFIVKKGIEKDNYLLIPEATTRGYKEAYDGDGVYINRPHQKRGVVQKGMIQTLKTSGNDVGVVDKGLRIRKLTPRECWRLMGIDDSYFNKADKYISDSQLYKQAGNAIVVDVIYYIIKSMI